ncbi:hypothetical protein AAG570_000103 [Ranatra chinensis]|uniref:Vacuolar protein sorting-associated protein 16 homolog n=1 Tax=Ranatra chinensis TaxID=642074 RepID=A0ABD0YW39_9HEMI
MTTLLTADWCQHGKDEYFRKFEVYMMEWVGEIKFDTVAFTSTQFGGPIAVTRDKTKVVKVQGTGKPLITIYTASGTFLSSFVWSSGRVTEMGWSSNLDLLCIQEDGAVLIYDMFGNYQHTFGMGQEAQDTKVIAAQVFSSAMGTGVAVLTTTHRVFLVNSVKEPKVKMLPEAPGVNVPPSAWLVVCPERHSRVLFARGKELYSLNEGDSRAVPLNIDLGADSYSIINMAVSSTYDYLAILNNRGKLWLGSLDVRKTLRLFDTWNLSLPKQLVWCGNDAVVINWGSDIEVIAFSEDSIRFNYDSSLFLVQEVDCTRVITLQSHEIIQKVPSVVKEIFRINSNAPGSYLLDASKQFQKKSHRANEYLHLVKPKLFTAVTQCVEAAGHVFSSDTQKMLMKAAQFGKTFLDDCSPETYVMMCRVLRCLNAVRSRQIGIPVTYIQLQVLTVGGLMDLLLIRRQYYLALEIAKFLKIPDKSKILSHWACYKVKQTSIGKDQIAREIADKLGRNEGVSYTAIAMKAADCGRTELAIKLIDYEPRATKQVPLLLRLKEDKAALIKAIDSGNTDLVFTVLLHLKENMQMARFQMEIRNIPLAQALYIKYCQQHNRETLKDIYDQEDNHNALAECFIRDSYSPRNSGMGEASLVAAQEMYKRAKNDVNAALCEEQLRLLKVQHALEEKFGKDLVGKSLHETLKLLLTKNEIKQADKLRADFKVPDRRYWWLRLKVIGEKDNWAELEKLSRVKKSPIGYEPFVDVCLSYDKKYEAQKYLPKIKDELKVKYLVKMG